jgi:hypothetical protein
MRPSSPGDPMETDDTPRKADEDGEDAAGAPSPHVPGLLGRFLSAVGLGGGRSNTGATGEPSSSDSDTSSRGVSGSGGLPPPSGLARGGER